MKKIFENRFGGIILLIMLFIIISFLSRTVLMIRSFSGIDFSVWEVSKFYITGLFFDVITISYIIIPFVIVNLFVSDKYRQKRFYKCSTYIIFFILFYLMLFNAVSEYFFWNEFGVRYNFIAVDYLVYTTEVVDNINESYPMPIILSSIFIGSLVILYYVHKKQYLQKTILSSSNLKTRFRLVSVYILIVILSALFVNQSYAEISKNRYHIELAKNGVYSFVTAFRNNELDYHEFYLTKNDESNIALLRDLLEEDGVEYYDDAYSIKRKVVREGDIKQYNVMLVVIESLSGGYMKFFGNERGMLPYLDSLIDHSVFFSNLYATGTRTVRGLEAISLSVPPTPGRSIVKRPDNKNMFSIGHIFKKEGYDTKFLYGGYGYFDNMNAFFSSNSFEIVDRAKMTEEEQTFTNAWGVCDEDLYNKALKEADESYKNGKPFLNFIMTTSNHRPFTFPEDKIDFPSGTDRMGGTLYSDFAINQFLNDAKNKEWFSNTIFIIIADHCGGSAGSSELPIKEYQIPMFIYNPEIFEPQIVDKMCSQVDLLPTLLGIMNWTYDSKFFGKDILKMTPEEERAFIGNYQKLGYMEKNKLVILGPMGKASYYKFDRFSGELNEISIDETLKNNAISYFQSANYFYKNKLNRWED